MTILLQSGPGKVFGTGYFCQISKCFTLFNSFNAAADWAARPFSIQLRFTVVF